MTTSLLWLGVLFLVAAATPGPTVLLAMTHGSRWGVRAAVPGLVGAVLSDAVLIAAVAFGAGTLIAQSAFWFSVLKWFGVAYLAWLGLGLLFKAGPAGTDGSSSASQRPTAWQVFRRSFVVAVTNPKGYLFFSALLPQFIHADQPVWPQLLAAAAVCMVIDGAVILSYAAVGAGGGRLLKSGSGGRRLCGATLCGMALALTGAERPG